MDVSIIIVNWNSATYLRQCLKSICAHSAPLSSEVIVVDNASFDGSKEMVARQFPFVKYVQSAANLGFAAANNLGFRHASGRNILFLNPDTEIVGRALSTMSEFLDATPGAGAAGCTLLNGDGTVQTSCVQSFPTVVNQALDIELLRRLAPRLALWGMRPLVDKSNKPQEAEALSGACIMVKRTAFTEIGGFSRNYFMYSEDIDLCYRLHRHQYKVYLLGSARVIHYGGGSSSANQKTFKNVVMTKEAVHLFFRRHYGERAARRYCRAMTAVALVRLFVIMMAFPLGVVLGKVGALESTFGKWMAIWRWSRGLEPWAAKKHRETSRIASTNSPSADAHVTGASVPVLSGGQGGELRKKRITSIYSFGR